MSSVCSNCYNGCPEIVSDQCVKYTGVDVPVLGIKNGDSLSYVECALTQFLASALDGTGIHPNLSTSLYCALINKYLPTCGDISAKVLFEVLVKAVCDLQEQVDDINTAIDEINSTYDVKCLDGVGGTSTTHQVVQAIIDKLCVLQTDFDNFVLDVEASYVQLADLNSLIAAYLATLDTANKYYTKMVPFTVVEYYGDLVGKFDVTGAGIGDWEKIYICNGLNGTPDKRGRVPVGVINGVGGGPLDPAVDPGVSPFNLNYTISGVNSKNGQNGVSLTSAAQLPSHTHTAVVTELPHTHWMFNTDVVTNPAATPISATTYSARALNAALNIDYAIPGTSNIPGLGITSSQQYNPPVTTGITVTNLSTGSSQPHANVQPSLACYYIMYIP